MNRRVRPALWAALIAAQTAQAEQSPVPLCAIFTPETAQSAAVQESWPLVLRNAFDANGVGHAQLNLTILMPVSRGDAAPCLASYLVENLQALSDGGLTGVIVPTNRDNPVFIYEKVTIDPTMIIDWRYTPTGGQAAFGGFGTRAQLAAPTEADLITLGLQPSAIPPGWK